MLDIGVAYGNMPALQGLVMGSGDEIMTDRKIEVIITGVSEKRDGHYAAYVKGLGLTAYGDTIQAARDRAMEMVGTVLNSLHEERGEQYVTDWLTKSDVEWRELSEGTWESSFIHSSNPNQALAV